MLAPTMPPPITAKSAEDVGCMANAPRSVLLKALWLQRRVEAVDHGDGIKNRQPEAIANIRAEGSEIGAFGHDRSDIRMCLDQPASAIEHLALQNVVWNGVIAIAD